MSSLGNQDATKAFSQESTLGWGPDLPDEDDRAHLYMKRALELRATARHLKDSDARAMVLQIARDYIILARAIENSAQAKRDGDPH